MKVDKRGKLVVPESSIEATCTQLLEFDGWRSLKMEQNFSERKVKIVGERGMADHLYIRYITPDDVFCLSPDSPDGSISMNVLQYVKRAAANYGAAQVMWIEWKSVKGKLSPAQRAWHEAERKRGALTLIAGIDFIATIEGWRQWYRESGLNRGKV